MMQGQVSYLGDGDWRLEMVNGALSRLLTIGKEEGVNAAQQEILVLSCGSRVMNYWPVVAMSGLVAFVELGLKTPPPCRLRPETR